MNTFPINRLEGGLISSKQHMFAFTCVTFKNGVLTSQKETEGAKLIFVLSGEIDVVIEGNSFRLEKGYWINIPKGMKYGVNVYRTTAEAKFCVLTCLRGSIENKIAMGDLASMPYLEKDGVEYILFGQESEVMQAKFIRFKDANDTYKVPATNEGFIYAIDGELDLKFFLKSVTLPKESVMFLPKDRKFEIKSSFDNTTALLVTSPANYEEVVEYVSFLKEKHGILWEESAFEI